MGPFSRFGVVLFLAGVFFDGVAAAVFEIVMLPVLDEDDFAVAGTDDAVAEYTQVPLLDPGFHRMAVCPDDEHTGIELAQAFCFNPPFFLRFLPFAEFSAGCFQGVEGEVVDVFDIIIDFRFNTGHLGCRLTGRLVCRCGDLKLLSEIVSRGLSQQ